MIAAKRAWSLYKKKKAAFITWPSKLCKLEKPLSLSLSLSLSPNPKIPYSHGEDLITCIILNIKDKYIHIDRIIKPVEALLDHVSLETAFLYFIVLILWIFASILHWLIAFFSTLFSFLII